MPLRLQSFRANLNIRNVSARRKPYSPRHALPEDILDALGLMFPLWWTVGVVARLSVK